MAYRVLIVDDSPAMRTFVRRVIELSGFELSACFEASHGAEALELLKKRVGGRDSDRYQHAGGGWRGVAATLWPRTNCCVDSGRSSFRPTPLSSASAGCLRWGPAATLPSHFSRRISRSNLERALGVPVTEPLFRQRLLLRRRKYWRRCSSFHRRKGPGAAVALRKPPLWRGWTSKEIRRVNSLCRLIA